MKIISVAPLLVASLVLIGCGSQKKAEIHIEKEIREVEINRPASGAELARDMINKNDKFSADQKQKLLNLQDKTVNKLAEIKDEIDKSRLVLIQTVLEPKMNNREYNILRKKITKLEKQKLDITFRAISDARDIIEPEKDEKNREFYRAFMHKHLQDY